MDILTIIIIFVVLFLIFGDRKHSTSGTGYNGYPKVYSRPYPPPSAPPAIRKVNKV